MRATLTDTRIASITGIKKLIVWVVSSIMTANEYVYRVYAAMKADAPMI